MKKILILFLIFMMVLLTGCPDKEEPKSNDNKTQVQKIDKDAAKEFMDNYMRYMMRGNNAALKSFYSDEIKEKANNVPEITNPGPVGFKLEEGENKSEGVEFTAHIYSASTDTPYYSDDTYKYSIKTEDGKMLIDKIQRDKSIEMFSKEDAIYKREGDKVIGEPVLKLEDLPLFTVPKGAGIKKYDVPRKSFGPCAIAPDSKSFIISSSGDDNSFLASLKMEESKETISLAEGGGNKQGGGGGQSGDGSQQGGQGQQEKKSPNVSIKPIDLYINTKITGIFFAPNGKMLAVEIIPPGGLTRVNLYKGKEWEQVKTDIDKHFIKDRFSIKNPYFVEDEKMIFTVEPIKDATPEEQTLRGEWAYDIKGDKVDQIK